MVGETPKVFISYAHDDVGWLKGELSLLALKECRLLAHWLTSLSRRATAWDIALAIRSFMIFLKLRA